MFVVKIFGLTLPLLIGAAYLALDEKPLLFESQESLTFEGHPIFNEVSYEATDEADIWKMSQSEKILSRF